MTKIMVTGAGSLLGQGIIRSLRMGWRPYHIIGVDPEPELSVGCHMADCSHRVPMASDESYLDAISETIDHERPDIVMIGSDAELPILAANRETLEAEFGTRILVSSPGVVAVADDKLFTHEWMDGQGFKPPRTMLGAETPPWGFPSIVKPRVGGGSRGVQVVNNSLEHATSSVSIDGFSAAEYVTQEYIDGPEYTAGAIYFGGDVATIVMRRDLRDGNTYRAYVEEFPELNAKVREWTLALKPHGPCNFQFRIDANGQPRCFEINARFSGTTPFRALAGFNEVEMCVGFLLYGSPIEQPVIKPMTILRYWNEMAVTK
jgi:carbamoyl-phosphate synthase large subunit